MRALKIVINAICEPKCLFSWNKKNTAHSKDEENYRDDNQVTQQGAVWMVEAHVPMKFCIIAV